MHIFLQFSFDLHRLHAIYLALTFCSYFGMHPIIPALSKPVNTDNLIFFSPGFGIMSGSFEPDVAQ